MANRSKRSCLSDSFISLGSWTRRSESFRDHWHAMSYENTRSSLLEPINEWKTMKSMLAYLQLVSRACGCNFKLTFRPSEGSPTHSSGQGHDMHIQHLRHRLR